MIQFLGFIKTGDLHHLSAVQKNMICLIISVLFSHFAPRDATLRNSLMHVHVRMTYEKNKWKIHDEIITLSEMGKENVHAKMVHSFKVVLKREV